MSDAKSRFGKLVRARREELGLRQDDLAEALEVEQPTVSGWETGRTLPNFALTLKVATVLQIDPAELLAILTAAEAENEPEAEAAVG